MHKDSHQPRDTLETAYFKTSLALRSFSTPTLDSIQEIPTYSANALKPMLAAQRPTRDC